MSGECATLSVGSILEWRLSDHFCEEVNIVFSLKRYGIDAMSAMAQGLFCTLLVGTILSTLGSEFHIGFLTTVLFTLVPVGYTTNALAGADGKFR